MKGAAFLYLMLLPCGSASSQAGQQPQAFNNHLKLCQPYSSELFPQTCHRDETSDSPGILTPSECSVHETLSPTTHEDELIQLS